MLFPLLTGHMFPRFCPSRNKLSGTGLHHIKARVALVHNLPLTWIHLRALACNHFPSRCCLGFASQILCIVQQDALVLMLLPLRLRTEDKETQTEESTFRTFVGKVDRSFHQSSRQKAMCLFPPKNAELAVTFCERWNRTNKRLADEVEIHGENGKRTAEYWRLFTILLLEGKLALSTCVLECCMGVIYW